MRVFGIALSILILSAPALAAEEEGSLKLVAWQAVNVAILVAVLYKFGRRPIKEYLEKRRKKVALALEEARRLMEEAENSFKEHEAKLSKLASEAEEIYERMIREGEAEKERIIREAQRGAQRIKEEARLLGELEVRKAKMALRREAADLAIRLAREKIEGGFTETDQKRSVEDFIEKLGSGESKM